MKGTFIWFIEEVGELAEAIGNYERNKDQESIDGVAKELADIFAWGSSLASILNIDLEKALKTKYPNYCIKCNANPCTCETKGVGI